MCLFYPTHPSIHSSSILPSSIHPSIMYPSIIHPSSILPSIHPSRQNLLSQEIGWAVWCSTLFLKGFQSHISFQMPHRNLFHGEALPDMSSRENPWLALLFWPIVSLCSHALFCCTSQVLHFLQRKGKTLHQQRECDSLYHTGLAWNPQYCWGMPVRLYISTYAL